MRTLAAFDAAIFDFDETMIELEAQHTVASEALCRELGSDYRALPETFRLSSGRRILDEVREMREHFRWPRPMGELMSIRQRHFREACGAAELRLLPCVDDVVRALREQGLRLAIASSAVGDEIDEILRRLGIRDAFELIVDGAQVGQAKPDPEAYLVAARKLGVAPERCIVFEDSNVGVMAAKRAGAYCIAVRNPRAHFPQDLSAADEVLESMCEFQGDRAQVTGDSWGH
jgi:HAD superfamily hydrolase (TIGR01509 family)